MSPSASLTRADLVHGLRSVGLEAGMHVVVHSALSRFGAHVEDGPHGVIDALEEVITPDGTLVMPTFSGETIYFLEALALQRGLHGPDARGRGVVFEGSLHRLWRKLAEISAHAGICYPFGAPDALRRRLLGEARHLQRAGWTVETAPGADSIRLARDAPPLRPEEVVPWRMPVWTGLIPETFWRRPETIRSHQYSGSFTAWGKLARVVLAGHDNRPGQRDEDHPLYRMKEAGGKILLIGVDHRSNSTIHVAQWFALRAKGVAWPETHNEFLDDFQRVDAPLDRAGGQLRGKIASADVRLADAGVLFAVVADLLDRKIAEGGYVPGQAIR